MFAETQSLTEKGERYYRTGDLAAYTVNGELEYRGRIDHQVKIRGFRIELGEIENVLSMHDSVTEAIVLAKDLTTGDKRLAAYVVIDTNSNPQSIEQKQTVIEKLRQHLSHRLPDYMVPSAIVLLDSLPLTPNGKVDRKALPEPDLSQQQQAYIAPATETEKVLCAIWQEVLGLERVGTSDNFFQLGGHSLLVMQVISRLQQAGITMAVRQLFATPTLAELAAAIDSSSERFIPVFTAPANRIPEQCDQITPDMLPLVNLSQDEINTIIEQVPGGVANVQDIYSLGALQEGILFHHMMHPYGDSYVVPYLFRIADSQAVTRFINALQFVVNRHDVLRTAVLWNALSVPVQVVYRHVEVPVSWVELTEGQDALGCMQSLCAPDIQQMDLTTGPLLKLHIATESETGEYFVVLQMHHIIDDAASLKILQKEIKAYWAGYASQLPPHIPYREFIAHAQHQAQQHDAQAYFQEALGDIDEPTAPFNLVNVQGDGSRIVEHKADVPEAVGLQLRSIAKDLKISPAALFHSAWALLVAGCSGRDDVVFGTVVSGRLQGTIGAENMLGVFINTLPLRVKLNNHNALSLVRQVHQSLLELLPYEQASLALAQRCTNLPSGIPLFSAMLNYRHSAPVDAGDHVDNADVQHYEDSSAGFEYIGGQERTNYPFNLSVDDLGEDGFALDVQVDSPVSAERITEYMQTAVAGLVAALASASDQPIAQLSILPRTERHQLLVEWNNTQADYPNDKCIHELFETQADANPHSIAVVFEDQQLTYEQLNQKANQLAHYLITEKHIKPDTLVGICVERSLDMVIAILAILKAGGAYVPLDPDYPEARLAYMLEDAKLSTVLTQAHLIAANANRTPISDEQAVCLDDENIQQQLNTQSTKNISPTQLGLTSSNLAYVIYTSGSTGNPKGVMVEHRALVNRIDWMEREYGCSRTDRVLQKTPFSFDVSVWEFVWPLTTGAGLVLAKPECHKDPVYLSQLIQQQQITHVHFVPSMLGSILSLGDLMSCTSLKKVFCSGEALAVQHVHLFQQQCPHAQLHNLYGPTEAAIDVSYWDCTQATEKTTSIPIGRPIHNIQLHILNTQEALTPLGATGELHIGGVGLARGYLHRDELTQEKFITNPFYDNNNPASSERLYKTGDLVRWLPDGYVEFLGRIDHQVKIRGFRIELGEIENALSTHEFEKETIVLAKDSATNDKRLVAYVVVDRNTNEETFDQPIFIEQLRTHLIQRLPDYMIPSAFVLLDALPLTPNGKVDRKALPEPDLAQQQQTYIAPVTETEKILCRIWQEVLGVERIGTSDNFFQLGGHSLLVMQVISRLQQARIRMAVRQLFSTPTLADLANIIDHSSECFTPVFTAPANLITDHCDAITPEMLPLVSLTQDEIDTIVNQVPGGVANVQDIYPLGPLQEGILFHHMMHPYGDPYVLPYLFRITDVQAVTRFINTLQFVINRHDVLRTAVLWNALSIPVRVVYRHVDMSVTWIELSEDQNAISHMQALCAPERQHMDLGKPSLLKLSIARDSASEQHVVLVQLHHIAADHVGLDVIQKELALYQMGKGQTLSSPIPYREFIAHVQHQAAQHNAEAFFHTMLGDIDEPTAPFNLVNVQGDGSRIVEAKADVPDTIGQQLRAIAKDLKVSPAALFHSAWSLLVAGCSGRDNVVFGTVVSGRLQGTIGAENMLGVFINTLPLRVKLDNQTAVDLVQQVHESLLELLPYEQASLALAQRCTQLPNGTPLFSAMMNYRYSGATEADYELNSDFEYLGTHERTNYPFSLSVDDLGHGFTLNAQIDSAANAERVVSYSKPCWLDW